MGHRELAQSNYRHELDKPHSSRREYGRVRETQIRLSCAHCIDMKFLFDILKFIMK